MTEGRNYSIDRHCSVRDWCRNVVECKRMRVARNLFAGDVSRIEVPLLGEGFRGMRPLVTIHPFTI